MMQFIKKYKHYFLSFIVPAILLLLVFFCLGFFYKDGKTIIVCDLDAQYKSLLIYFKEHLFTNYSFQKGLGGGMVSTYAYYLLSPFNFITLFFPSEHIHVSILLIIYLKLCLSGFTMYLFLSKTMKKNHLLLLISTCYVFTAFTVNYIYHIMWLDAIYMLPLVTLGLYRLIHEKSPYLYMFSLTYSIITNYYMGFIICIFSFLYFIYESVLTYTKKDKKKIIFIIQKFLFYSIMAAVLCAFILIPVILSFKNLQQRGLELSGLMTYLNPLMPISKLFLGAQDNQNILAHTQYQLYCGILTLILVFFFFVNEKISKKEKVMAGFVIFIFILSLSIDYLYYIWHGLTPPNCFAGRFTFTICFFLLLLGAKSILYITYIEKKWYFIVAPIYPILGILVFFSNFSYVKTYLIWVSVIIFFMHVFLLYCLKIEKYKKLAEILLFLLVSSELMMNMFFSLKSYPFVFKKQSIGEYKTTKTHMNKILSKDPTPFYRTEKNHYYSRLDSFAFNYNSMSLFLSTLEKNQALFLSKVGYYTVTNEIEYDEKAPVMDSLLGIKYIFSKQKETPYYKNIDTYDVSTVGSEFYDVFKSKVYVYQNDYALSLGTLVENNVKDCKIKYRNNDRLDYQNQLMSCLVAKKVEIYENIPVQKENENTYHFEVNDKKDIYFFPNITNDPLKRPIESVEVFLENYSLGVYSNIQFRLQKINNQSSNHQSYQIRIFDKGEGKTKVIPYVYLFDEKNYQEVFSELKNHSMQILEMKDGYIKGKAKATKENHYLFTTIPNIDGFTVYVDGKKKKYDTVFDTFIGLDLEEGNHTIEFIYKTPGCKVGIFITLLGIFVLIVKEYYQFYLKKLI